MSLWTAVTRERCGLSSAHRWGSQRQAGAADGRSLGGDATGGVRAEGRPGDPTSRAGGICVRGAPLQTMRWHPCYNWHTEAPGEARWRRGSGEPDQGLGQEPRSLGGLDTTELCTGKRSAWPVVRDVYFTTKIPSAGRCCGPSLGGNQHNRSEKESVNGLGLLKAERAIDHIISILKRYLQCHEGF